MSLPLPELVEEGPLAPGAFFRLYYLIASDGLGGMLRLHDPVGVQFDFGFKRGAVELARCNDPSLDFLAWLVGEGRLDPEARRRVESMLPGAGGDPVAALFASGALPPADILEAVGRHGRTLLSRALLLQEGSFAWKEGEALGPATFPLGERWPLLLDAARSVDPRVIRERLEGLFDRPVMRAGDGQVSLDALGLNAQEVRAMHAFDGTRSLEELIASSSEDAALLRTAWTLSGMGLASFGAAPKKVWRAPESPRPQPGVREASAGPRADVRETSALPRQGIRETTGGPRPAAPVERYPTDLEGVSRFLASLEGKNHFEVLGLPTAAPTSLVKQAYFQRARAFHPDTVGAGSEELRSLKEAITARLNEAYSVLGDDARRAEYAAALQAGATSSTVDIANLVIAEECFRRAEILIRARRWADALDEIERAIECNPEEGEFYALRAWARFSATLDKRVVAADVKADLDRALRLNDRCLPAFLYGARIHTVLGDVGAAIQYYRRCLALDASHIEAQRELRLLESRSSR